MYIKKVEIKNLWGHDFVWTLHEDVNVLIGPNGAGKSMMLRMIHEAILPVEDTELNFRLFDPIDEIIIELEDDIVIRANSESRAITSNKPIETYTMSTTSIDTFDVTEKSPDPNMTLLDYQLEKLKQLFVTYQRDLSNKVEETLTNGNRDSKSDDLDLIAKIYDTKNIFLKILDELFSPTGKKFDEKEFYFQKTGSTQHPILPENLSSGEKQILIILLNALLQGKEKHVMFMDEPEISLHVDWQRKLIGYIRQINPNVQIILATHSPTVYYQGWTEKATRIEEVQKLATSGSLIISEKTKHNEDRTASIFSNYHQATTKNPLNIDYQFNNQIYTYTVLTKEECLGLLSLFIQEKGENAMVSQLTFNILISKVNGFLDAKEILNRMHRSNIPTYPNTVTLNTLMRKINTIEQGLELLQIKPDGNRSVPYPMNPDITTFSILMGKAKTTEEVKAIEDAQKYYGIKPNEIYTNKLKFKR